MLDNKFIKISEPFLLQGSKNYFFQTKKHLFIKKWPILPPGYPKNGHTFEMPVAYTLLYYMSCISIANIFNYFLSQEVDAQVDASLSSGVIRPSTSGFASNIVVARKKDGRARVCINYKPLNTVHP